MIVGCYRMRFLNIDYPEAFLQEGDFTRFSDITRKKGEELAADGPLSLKRISKYVSSLMAIKSERDKEKIFRLRTASEILESGKVSGCTDQALAFIVLARQRGTPTRYVETFEKQWHINRGAGKIQGHVFVDVFLDRWYTFDPSRGFSFDGKYVRGVHEYIEVGKGLDFSVLYVKDKITGIYHNKPINLQHNEDIRELASSF